VIHEKSDHVWVPIPGLEHFPQRLCECGAVKATGGVQAGDNTVTISPSADANRIDFSASSAATTAAGQIGMDVDSGYPKVFVNGENTLLAAAGDGVLGPRRQWVIQQNAGLTTLNQYGFTTAPTITGTAALDDTGSAQFIQYTTAVGPNTDAGWLSSAFSQTRREYAPQYEVCFRLGGAVTSTRLWLGLFASTPMASATPAIHYAAFRYDTVADGTAFFRCVTDNATGVPTVTTTTVAVSANGHYRLRMVLGTANVKFYNSDTLVATNALTLPANGVNLGHVDQVRVLAASALALRLGKVALSQRAALLGG
jgi:hypothetical protein